MGKQLHGQIFVAQGYKGNERRKPGIRGAQGNVPGVPRPGARWNSLNFKWSPKMLERVGNAKQSRQKSGHPRPRAQQRQDDEK